MWRSKRALIGVYGLVWDGGVQWTLKGYGSSSVGFYSRQCISIELLTVSNKWTNENSTKVELWKLYKLVHKGRVMEVIEKEADPRKSSFQSNSRD